MEVVRRRMPEDLAAGAIMSETIEAKLKEGNQSLRAVNRWSRQEKCSDAIVKQRKNMNDPNVWYWQKQ